MGNLISIKSLLHDLGSDEKVVFCNMLSQQPIMNEGVETFFSEMFLYGMQNCFVNRNPHLLIQRLISKKNVYETKQGKSFVYTITPEFSKDIELLERSLFAVNQ